ncbi:hypothetical protein C6501_17730 [Candidatus Poribacteria bacterium]|nr:MAG: hypothetical protein C6501_17730 [Candidatus Poribacteria bacterium]
MFRKNFTTIAIAAVIASLLLIGIYSSQADEITSLSASAYTDYGSGGDIWASLSADADILYIDWSAKQTYPADEADKDWVHVRSSMYSKGTRSVSFEHLGTLDGSLKIAEYSFKAKVWFWDAEKEPDTETSTFSISKTLSTSVPRETQKYPHVPGYADLSGQYYSGGDIVMSCSVYAYSRSEKKIQSAQSIFNHALNRTPGGAKTKIREEPKDENGVHVWKEIRKNDPERDSSYSDSDSGEMTHFGVGPFRENESASSSVYVRLSVGGFDGTDEYYIQNSENFDINDNE